MNYNTPDFLMMQTLIQGGQGPGQTPASASSSSSLPTNSTKTKNTSSGGNNSPHTGNIPPSLRGGLTPLELVKLYRIHAPLYPTPSSTLTPTSSSSGQGVTMRVFTVLRPDQLAQVSHRQHLLYHTNNIFTYHIDNHPPVTLITTHLSH